MFWTLLRLRYRLIWAQARTSGGKVAFFAMGYLLLGGSILLLVLLGGLSGGLMRSLANQAEVITRGIMATIFVAGMAWSVLLGVGPRAAFADKVLRRYPLNRKGRLVYRHMLALFDPVWLLMIAVVVGLAIGLAIVGGGSILTGLPGALFFIAASYLMMALALTFVDWLLQRRGGSAWISLIFITPLSLMGVILPRLIDPSHPERAHFLGEVLRYTPAGAAAVLLTNTDPAKLALNGLLLLLWCFILLQLLGWLEGRPEATDNGAAGTASQRSIWTSTVDRLAGLFPPQFAPFAGKALRYYLRSSQVKMNLIMIIFPVLMGRLMGHGLGNGFMITLPIFFFVGFGSNNAMTANQFGYDGAGARRYAFLPFRFSTALVAYVLVALTIGLGAIGVALLLWIPLAGYPVTPQMVGIVLCNAIAGLFFFNGLGLWTSVLQPWRADLQKVMGNKPPLLTQLIVGLPMVMTFSLMPFLSRLITFKDLLDFWWVFPAFILLGLGFFLISLYFTARLVNNRRELIIEKIAGATAN